MEDIDELPKNDANYTSLTPLWFLDRAATVHPNRTSVVHGARRFTWLHTYRRCRRFASALRRLSIGPSSTVLIIAPNVPAIYEAHFGVPMSGAVLNTVNIRLNAETVGFLLGHSQSILILVDQEFFTLVEEALKILAEKEKNKFKPPILIVIADDACDPKDLEYALSKGAVEYEKFLETGDPEFAWQPPKDEWQSITLGYTSGTTASPKGVVLHHRGAYLMAMSNVVVWQMTEGPVYLWTLPMFHCNGWCFTWTLAALCGTSICLRQVTAKAVYQAIAKYGVTHFCAAPVVLNTIVNAKNELCGIQTPFSKTPCYNNFNGDPFLLAKNGEIVCINKYFGRVRVETEIKQLSVRRLELWRHDIVKRLETQLTEEPMNRGI